MNSREEDEMLGVNTCRDVIGKRKDGSLIFGKPHPLEAADGLGSILTKKELAKLRKDLKDKDKSMPLKFETAQLKHLLKFYIKNLENIDEDEDKKNIRLCCKDKEIRRKIR